MTYISVGAPACAEFAGNHRRGALGIVFGIVLLIVLNLAIGYALALYQYRPDLLPLIRFPMPATDGALRTTVALTDGMSMPPASSFESVPSSDETFQAEAAVGIAEPLLADEQPASSMDAVIAQQIEAVALAASAPEPAETVEPAVVHEAGVAEDSSPQDDFHAHQGAVVAAVSAFKTELNDYRTEIHALDNQIRNHSHDSGTFVVQKYVDRFDQLSDQYLQRQELHLSSIQRQSQSLDAKHDLTEPCREAALNHAAAIASTRENLSAAAMLADAAAACKAFLLATSQVADASEELESELGHTLARVAHAEPEPAIDQRNSSARPAKAAGKSTEAPANLEDLVADFVANNTPASGRYGVALVEIDQMTTVHKKHGRAACDRLMQAVAQSFRTFVPNITTTIDQLRQQLLCFLPDTSIRDCTSSVEQVRLRIEATKVSHDNAPIKVTVSCGIAEADCQEQPTSLAARLRELLRQAQRYGRNRSFFQEGEQSAPAIPPKIEIETRQIEI